MVGVLLDVVRHMPLYLEVATFDAVGMWVVGSSTTAEHSGAI